MHRTAGAANARIVKKSIAYELASIPVFPVPIRSSKGCRPSNNSIVKVNPRTKDNDKTCPPNTTASFSLPDDRLIATSGVVVVHRKLKR